MKAHAEIAGQVLATQVALEEIGGLSVDSKIEDHIVTTYAEMVQSLSEHFDCAKKCLAQVKLAMGT